jgi:hypothetical protein
MRVEALYSPRVLLYFLEMLKMMGTLAITRPVLLGEGKTRAMTYVYPTSLAGFNPFPELQQSHRRCPMQSREDFHGYQRWHLVRW